MKYKNSSATTILSQTENLKSKELVSAPMRSLGSANDKIPSLSITKLRFAFWKFLIAKRMTVKCRELRTDFSAHTLRNHKLELAHISQKAG